MGALDGHRLADSEAVQEAAELLSQVLAQDITGPGEGNPGESGSGGDRSEEEGSGDEASSNNSSNNDSGGAGAEEGPRIREGVATDRVISTVDPEMRHGRKSSSQRFDGYKVHITEAVESEFITGVAAGPDDRDGPSGP